MGKVRAQRAHLVVVEGTGKGVGCACACACAGENVVQSMRGAAYVVRDASYHVVRQPMGDEYPYSSVLIPRQTAHRTAPIHTHPLNPPTPFPPAAPLPASPLPRSFSPPSPSTLSPPPPPHSPLRPPPLYPVLFPPSTPPEKQMVGYISVDGTTYQYLGACTLRKRVEKSLKHSVLDATHTVTCTHCVRHESFTLRI